MHYVLVNMVNMLCVYEEVLVKLKIAIIAYSDHQN